MNGNGCPIVLNEAVLRIRPFGSNVSTGVEDATGLSSVCDSLTIRIRRIQRQMSEIPNG